MRISSRLRKEACNFLGPAKDEDRERRHQTAADNIRSAPPQPRLAGVGQDTYDGLDNDSAQRSRQKDNRHHALGEPYAQKIGRRCSRLEHVRR